MKKIFSIALAAMLFVLCLSGCGSKFDRLNYVKGLEKYVELCDLENIKVDCNSDEYSKTEKELLSADLETYTFEVTEGKVEEGDTANIDYAGKVDGVAFTGGTAEGYDLTIGSGTFVEGFEDQLVGVEVGKTVDITVTFPSDYGESTDLETGKETINLSGAEAVFTVTINKIARPYSEVNDEFAKAAGFDDADKYMADLKERTINNVIYSFVMNNSKLNELPPDKDGNCYEYHKSYYSQMASQYGMTFADLLSNYQLTEVAFKEEMLTEEIISYAVFDKLGLEVTDEAIDAKIAEMAEMYGATEEEVIEYYGDNFLEFIYVNNEVVEELAKIATVIEKE